MDSTTSNQYTTSNKQQATNTKQQTTNKQPTNNKQQLTNNKQLTTNKNKQTNERTNKQQTNKQTDNGKVKGHASSGDVAQGIVTIFDKKGNVAADALAVAGTFKQAERPRTKQKFEEKLSTAMSVQTMMVEL